MLSDFSNEKGFSLPSWGLRDSVEPLFLSDRVGGRSFSVNRASSICLRAIWLLSSSNRVFQSGMDVQRVWRASKVEKVAIVENEDEDGKGGGERRNGTTLGVPVEWWRWKYRTSHRSVKGYRLASCAEGEATCRFRLRLSHMATAQADPQ